jgi:hypothetical protein
MKKIFVCLLAVAALASCQKNEIISTVGGPAIAFENAFVDKATKADPSTTTASITDFEVWGYMDSETGIVFNEELVSKSGSNWTYADTQYWVPGKSYTFHAVNPTDNDDVTVNVTEGTADVVTIDFVNTDGTVDLLYDTKSVNVPAESSAMAKVGFSFQHLLSKVKFTFANGFDNPNSTIVITEVKMTAPAKGQVNIDSKAWTLGSENVTLAFGDVNGGANLAAGASSASADERLTIPAGADQKYVVTFTVQLYQGEVLAVESKLQSVVKGAVLEVGKAYNFTAEINASNILGPDAELLPIEFTVVKVDEWIEAEKVSSVLKETSVAEGESYMLVTDAVADARVNVAGTFDGAGHTVTAGELSEVVGGTLPMFYLNNDKAIVRNTTIDGQNASVDQNGTNYGVRNIVVAAAGEYTIDNVKSFNATYPLYVAASDVVLNVVNSELEGWTSYGDKTVGKFTNVDFTVGPKYGTFRPHGAAYLTDCTFDEGFAIRLDQVNSKCYVAGVLDGAGATVTIADKRADNGIIRPIASSTIKNLTINGGKDFATADGKGLRGIYVNQGGEYVLDGVTITGVTYAFNINTTSPVTLTVKNSTLQGWISYGNSTTASFEKVNFICGGNFDDNFKPYTSVVLTDCTFEAGFQIDFTSLDGVITFKNCKYGDTVLTAENFATVAKIDGDDFAGKIAF